MKKYLLAMLIVTMFTFIGCTEAVTDTGDNDNTKTEETTTASYTVEHYQQNIENDEFTLVNDDTEEKSGKIGEDTKAIAKTYDGFTAKTVTQEKIADGGSTVVKIEYTRNVVTLTFDTDGGSEIKSKSGKYGAELTVEAPTKEGYTFNSWNPALPTTYPAADTAYKAKWAIEGDYTITYELYEGTNAESNPVSYNVETATITLAEATKENYVFDGWYTDESFTDENKVTTIEKGSTGDITLYAKWIELITASNVAEKIKALTKGTHTITMTGTISSSTISDIKTALESLSSNVYVNLDLSKTTGLTTIGEEALKNADQLTSSILPDSVTSISNSAFYDCEALASVIIPDSVTTIGESAFYDCDALTSVTIPDSVTSIGDYAFEFCSNLESITIPDSVTEIGNMAFYSCNKMTSATIGSGITTLGNLVFDSCSALETLTINTADNCFYSKNPYNEKIITLELCSSNVKKLTISDDVSYIAEDAFKYCKEIEEIITGNGITSLENLPLTSALKSITIGEKITTIGMWAFKECTNLTSIVIPDNVTTLNNLAFSGCTALTSITIGSGVTSLSGSVFEGCDNLTSVQIDENNTKYTVSDNCIYSKDGKTLVFCIGNPTTFTIKDTTETITPYAFQNCTNLTSITIPNSVTTIYGGAFQNCTGLTAVTIPDNVTSIYSGAFKNCTNLESVTIGSGLSSLDPSMFTGCTKLTTLTVSESNTNFKSIDNCIYSKDGTKFHFCATGLTEVTILDGVTSIGNSTFSDNTVLTSITIPDSVESIDNNAFSGCTALASITIPDSVTTIGTWAFYNCSGLKTVTIGSGVTKMGYYAFSGCSSLESVTFADTSTWYYTSSSDYTGGTEIDVTDTATNVTNLKSYTYNSKYWYKEASSIE